MPETDQEKAGFQQCSQSKLHCERAIPAKVAMSWPDGALAGAT